MKRLIIGTAGHIDHGKSELVKALTGTDPDRLKEEKERGITIELGFASIDLPSGIRAGIVDVPGHEKFVRNMVAGATGVDLLLLIIAADEGVMPQTREHTDICKLLGIDRAICVLTKVDKVDEEWLLLVEEEVRAFLDSTFLSGCPMVCVSSITGEGLPDLVETIDSIAADLKGKHRDRPLRFPVDRVFTLKGIGTVVTGTLASGTFKRGEEVIILPAGKKTRVRYIESHGEKIEEAEPGSRTAANLSGLSKDEIERGSVITREGEGYTTNALDAMVENLSVNTKPFLFGTRLNLHYGTTYTQAVVQPYGRKEIAPGESKAARIHLFDKAVLTGKERFILRGYRQLENFGYTVGGGTVINPLSPRRKPARLKEPPESLMGLLSKDVGEQVLAAAWEFSEDFLTAKKIAVVTGLSFEEVNRSLADLCEEGEIFLSDSGTFILWSSVDDACRTLHSSVTSLSNREKARSGFSLQEIVSRAKHPLSSELASLAIRILAERGTVIKTEEGFLPSGARDAREGLLIKALASISRFIEKRGLTGPTLAEIAKSAGIPERESRQLITQLLRDGSVFRSREFFFSSKSVDTLEEKLVAHLKDVGKITISQFKDITGTSRKYSVPLMELMDQRKITIRQGDYRVLWKR